MEFSKGGEGKEREAGGVWVAGRGRFLALDRVVCRERGDSAAESTIGRNYFFGSHRASVLIEKRLHWRCGHVAG